MKNQWTYDLLIHYLRKTLQEERVMKPITAKRKTGYGKMRGLSIRFCPNFRNRAILDRVFCTKHLSLLCSISHPWQPQKCGECMISQIFWLWKVISEATWFQSCSQTVYFLTQKWNLIFNSEQITLTCLFKLLVELHNATVCPAVTYF